MESQSETLKEQYQLRFSELQDYISLTEQSCAELLRMKGFSIVKCLARFLPFSMSGNRKSPLFMVRLYLKLPQIWPLFGKQFLVIGKKISP